jgi:hypothetical protein
MFFFWGGGGVSMVLESQAHCVRMSVARVQHTSSCPHPNTSCLAILFPPIPILPLFAHGHFINTIELMVTCGRCTELELHGS